MDVIGLAEIGVVAAAGLMRGITGFGGAMLMTPVLAVLIDPVTAVATALILEASAALVMFPGALPRVQWPTVLYLSIPAIFTVPLGGYLLLTLDPVIARKLVAAVVVTFSLMMLLGFRHSGPPRAATLLALGSLVGALLGATSVGAPPVILYLLSGPDSAAVTRANLTVFITAVCLIGIAMLAVAGAITVNLGLSAAGLVGPYLLATWLGAKFFARLSDRNIRRLALVLMLSVGVVGLAV